MLQALIAKAGELKEQGLAPDMVFVTGDIAYSGKPKEYEQATRFFTELNKVLNLDPKECWFLVPGNHDVDRSRITRSHKAIKAGLTDEVAVEETLRDPGSMRLLSAPLEAYYNFAAAFLGTARAMQPDRPWRTDVREVGGVPVGVLQLNSAWIAEGGEADDGKLLIGEAQVREALDATPDVFLRIALMHHPMRNLREFDANRVESLLSTTGGAAFLLRGHLHLNRTKIQSSPDGHLVEIAAGTLYTDESAWPRGFHLGEVDLGKGEARIHLFHYSGEGKGFFAPDNLTYENAPKGICKIPLPSVYRLGGKNTKPTKAVSEAQRITFTARYRAAAANYHGHARFIGFPNQAARPNARVSDLFVPLKMKGGTFGTKLNTTAGIAERLLGARENGPARIVLLGDPGSGKTTLSRFLVMLAAGAIELPGVDVVGEPLPLRVAFRDFVERRRENPSLSLLDYLELQARTELSLALPKNFLSTAIEEGQAILLLDGLDEVGAPEHRATMRNLVAAFSAAHAKLPILVTSRISGYHDASLYRPLTAVRKRLLFVSFSELVLEKFDDDDLRTFVAQWYSVQEPIDPVARDRGIADLLAALNADERVRALARTPILATLVAMIHRVEANLPGERAKLYELCVRMLLETWPAQRKRPFAEIDPGLQRAYLESLAFEMQCARGTNAETVTITRGVLVKRLLPILRKRDFASEPEETVSGVIERWIDHLEKHSGILTEQRTGVFGFFHLSIMEYLAARGMERELGRDGAIESIAEHFMKSVWREVCLLSVGSNAEDADFLDAVYHGVGKSTDDTDDTDGTTLFFLLRCLCEEARFRPEQRESIFSRYLGMFLVAGRWSIDPMLISQIGHFSVRHGEALQRWIEDRLDHATGDELAATVAIPMLRDSEAVIGRLASRPDRPSAATSLLEFFWPGSEVGEWAAREAGAEEALRWSGKAAYELAPLRAVAGLSEPAEPLAAASIITLSSRTLLSYSDGKVNLKRVATLPRPGGRGMPAQIAVRPGGWILPAQPRAPHRSVLRSAGPSPRFASDFGHNVAHDFASNFARDWASYDARDFANNLHLDFPRSFYPFVASDFKGYFASDFASKVANDLAVDVAHYLASYARDVARDFALVFSIDSTHSASRPVPSRMPAPNKGFQNESESRRAFTSALASVAGESWIALATMAMSEGANERRAYLAFRVQNRWLFEVWSAIDRRLPDNPSPAQLALYFALGWTQSTTTWAWPDTERWRTLFAAGPGEHWLVRSQWHLCRLTDDPDSVSDQAALAAALRDGRRDGSLPGYAARLGEVLGVE